MLKMFKGILFSQGEDETWGDCSRDGLFPIKN